MRKPALFTVLSVALVWLASPVAQAQDTDTSAQTLADPAAAGNALVDAGPTGMLRLGKSYTFGGGADVQHGFGLDLRYELYPESDMDGYLGLFGHTEYQTGDAWRFSGGFAAGWGVFGLELGVSHRTETANYAGTTGLHIGQAFTFGPVSVGGRLTIPLYDHASQNIAASPAVQGIEGALVVRMSFGFRVHGESRNNGCHAHEGQLRDPHSDGHHGHH